MEVVSKTKKPSEASPETPVMILAKRIRVMLLTTELSFNEVREVIMSAKNPPTEEEFYLAHYAAMMLQLRSGDNSNLD